MSKPSILFLNRVYPPVRGATGRMLKDLAQSFSQKGWDVTVLSSAPEAQDTLQGDGIRHICVKGAERPKNIVSYIAIWLKMRAKAKKLERHDVIVSMSDPPLIMAAGDYVAKKKGSKHIIWSQDLYPDLIPALGMKMPEFLMRYFYKCRRKAMKNADKIISCGACMAEYLADEGIDPSKIDIIPNWSDHELNDPKASEQSKEKMLQSAKDMLPSQSGVRPFEQQLKTGRRFRVLYAGNIGLAHPIDIILNAAEIFNKDKSDIEFVFIGDGERFDYIAEQRAERGLDNVRILPFQPASHLREVMESGDVHVVTMKNEASGLLVPCKIYSAFAVARPSIFIGPIEAEPARLIQNYGAGFVIAQDDTANLVNAIRYYRESGEAWFDAHNGAMRARETLLPQNAMESWESCATALAKQA